VRPQEHARQGKHKRIEEAAFGKRVVVEALLDLAKVHRSVQNSGAHVRTCEWRESFHVSISAHVPLVRHTDVAVVLGRHRGGPVGVERRRRQLVFRLFLCRVAHPRVSSVFVFWSEHREKSQAGPATLSLLADTQ